MANRLIRPLLNPVHLVPIGEAINPAYQSKHRNDYLFVDTIRSWEQPLKFKQKWLTGDSIRLQYTSNYSPVTLKVFRCDGSEIYSIDFALMQQDMDNPGFFIRQIDLALGIFPLGDYYLEVWAGTPIAGVPPVLRRSEPMTISDNLPNSLLFEYSHFEKTGGIWFDAPFSPMIRVPASLVFEDTESLDTIYPDQDQNEELLHSTQYVVSRLLVGGAVGIPPWLKDILSRILGCSDVRIDGRYYTKPEDAKWEPNGVERYPMKGWTINLREKFNRDSEIVDNDAVLKGIAAAGLIVDATGFGISDDAAGNTYIPIESLI